MSDGIEFGSSPNRKPVSRQAAKAVGEHRIRQKKYLEMVKKGQTVEAAAQLAVELHFQLLMALDADLAERAWGGGQGVAVTVRDDELAEQVRELTKSLAQAINQVRGLERDGAKFADEMTDAEKKSVVREYLKTLPERERKALLE